MKNHQNLRSVIALLISVLIHFFLFAVYFPSQKNKPTKRTIPSNTLTIQLNPSPVVRVPPTTPRKPEKDQTPHRSTSIEELNTPPDPEKTAPATVIARASRQPVLEKKKVEERKVVKKPISANSFDSKKIIDNFIANQKTSSLSTDTSSTNREFIFDPTLRQTLEETQKYRNINNSTKYSLTSYQLNDGSYFVSKGDKNCFKVQQNPHWGDQKVWYMVDCPEPPKNFEIKLETPTLQ